MTSAGPDGEPHAHATRDTGVLLVIAGPSGAGKGTIVQRLREREPSLRWSVSWTTRAPRDGEVHDVDYHFTTRDEFERLRDADGFLEWFDVYGDLKGTPDAPVREYLANGQDVLLEVDVKGALAIRRKYPEAVLVFVRPPSREVQQARLVSRGQDTPEQIERRLAAAAAEEQEADRFDFVIQNDDVDRAVAEVAAILAGRRAAQNQA
ncbi:MAG: guanylate kinase [Actinomycetota bacterium]|jgi:guanylate kinase|nr:guanylate kinase [Actinomycetota bacterium]